LIGGPHQNLHILCPSLARAAPQKGPKQKGQDMKKLILRGVPRSILQDGWWLSETVGALPLAPLTLNLPEQSQEQARRENSDR
jgi:hypothetical protein